VLNTQLLFKTSELLQTSLPAIGSFDYNITFNDLFRATVDNCSSSSATAGCTFAALQLGCISLFVVLDTQRLLETLEFGFASFPAICCLDHNSTFQDFFRSSMDHSRGRGGPSFGIL